MGIMRLSLLRSFLVLSLVVGLFPVPVAQATAPVAPSLVRIIRDDSSGTVIRSFEVATANPIGGVSLATADLGTDGVPEILVGSGLGNEPRVYAYRADGSLIGSFLAYDSTMGMGVNVVACDLNGDGVTEIVTAPQRGGGPHVRVFNNYGSLIDPGFFAFDESFTGGVNLACGDLDENRGAELVTMPGVGGGPHVRVWNRTSAGETLVGEWFAFDGSDTRGVAGVVTNRSLRVSTVRGKEHVTRAFSFSQSKQTQTNETISNNDANGLTNLFSANDRTYRASSSQSHWQDVDNFSTSSVQDSIYGSLVGAGADIDRDGTDELIIADGRTLFGGEETGRSIVVDVSEQRLYAYTDGVLDNSFQISSARAPFQTPLGKHSILAKIPLVHYAGGSGADAYDLGWVPYNLRFYPHIYIHYAPWHNNFGYPMSHGCVNVSLENIKWIYDWASEGDVVTVQE